ncbi:MAG: prepilin-type N-terminal cleavage/methylation domain-containing protein [Actinomycetes bacterium]
MRSSNLSRRHGFTMIELLIVIIVIGILAAIAIPLYMSQRTKAKDAAVKEGVHVIQVGVVSWAADHGGDPNEGYPLTNEVNLLDWKDRPTEFSAYVKPWPTNPFTGAPMRGSWDVGNYTYHCPASTDPRDDRPWYLGMPDYALFGHLSTGKTFPSQ